MKNKNKKNNNKSKIVSRFFDSSHVGSEVTLTEVKERAFFSFFPVFSITAKILPHLRLSWLYLIYLIKKCINFSPRKRWIFPKFSSLITCGFVASPNQYLGGMGSNPVRALTCFLQSTFPAIGKIAAHLRGSCLHLILIRKSKQTYFITDSYRKVAQ